MDAQDIFKKLSRGAIFSKPKAAKPKVLVSKTINKTAVKEEPVETNSTIDFEEDLTLLGDLKVAQNGTKARKRKAKKAEIDIEAKKIRLAEEEVNRFRNEQNISVVGRHVAEPVKSFEELDVKSYIKQNLKNCGYGEPTPIQKQAIPIMLENRQVLACAPTGSGKTAAFLTPILHDLDTPQKAGPRALILCPTRELAKQIQRECFRLVEGGSLRVHIITKIQKEGVGNKQKYDILITTPKRLCYLLDQDTREIVLNKVKWLIIDEADKLFEEGTYGFKDQLTQIMKACDSPKKTIAMFSATYTPAVAKWCVHNMKGLIRITVGQRNAATDLVDQELLFVGNESGKLLAVREQIRRGMTPPVLIFVQSKERAQQLFSELIYDGINVDAIHADRTQLQRDNTVRSFREGRIWVLICTELMARGLDFKGVNLVINYDFPTSAISYIHRVGRAGRAGLRGKAITYFTIDDTINLRSIARVLIASGCQVPDYMLKLKKHSRREKKKLTSSAPVRDDILTTPYDDRRKIDKALGKNRPPTFKTNKKKQVKDTKKKVSKENIDKEEKRKLNKTPKKSLGKSTKNGPNKKTSKKKVIKTKS